MSRKVAEAKPFQKAERNYSSVVRISGYMSSHGSSALRWARSALARLCRVVRSAVPKHVTAKGRGQLHPPLDQLLGCSVATRKRHLGRGWVVEESSARMK